MNKALRDKAAQAAKAAPAAPPSAPAPIVDPVPIVSPPPDGEKGPITREISRITKKIEGVPPPKRGKKRSGGAQE